MLQDQLSGYKIILASQSPRRQQLLKELGISFEVAKVDFNENYPSHLKGKEIAIYLAQSKAGYFKSNLTEGEIVITADTIVWCDEKVLNKPATRHEAYRMLNELSGNTHEVITGVNLLSVNKEKTFSETTKVVFESLTDEEIFYYIDTFTPYDKAGAYGIQEWIGIAACSRIEGSYFNVVGLPVQRLYSELKDFVLQY